MHGCFKYSHYQKCILLYCACDIQRFPNYMEKPKVFLCYVVLVAINGSL